MGLHLTKQGTSSACPLTMPGIKLLTHQGLLLFKKYIGLDKHGALSTHSGSTSGQAVASTGPAGGLFWSKQRACLLILLPHLAKRGASLAWPGTMPGIGLHLTQEGLLLGKQGGGLVKHGLWFVCPV